MTQRGCSIEDCGEPHYALGWCGLHWRRNRYYGSPTAGRVLKNTGPCSVEGCSKPADTRGWCQAHYMRWVKTGTVADGPQANRAPAGKGPTHGRVSTYHGKTACRCDLCRTAAREAARARRAKDPEFYKAEARASYKRHQAKRREYVFVKSYGMTYAERDEMIAAQGGVCAICGGGGKLEADHCHDLGHVRGMLCGACNKAIGIMANDPDRLRQAADYLERTAR